MSSAFLLCIALQHILPVAGAPTHVPPPNYGSSKLPNILDESPPPIFGNDRSIFDLIWSCLTTVVACSWVSVHPNMPGSNESFARTHIRHLAYLFWAVIAPEAVVFWAAKQWFGARQLANDFKDYGWTMTHGHFLQMGGFVLYENGEETKVVNPEHLRKLLDEGRVELPKVRKKDIEDRSKASDFGKALVVIQTAWFVVQCITRHVNHLPITKLELVTVALALLNGAMYVCWWHKPFDAQTRIAIHVLPQPEPKKSENQETGGSIPRSQTRESVRSTGIRTCDCTLSHLVYNLLWHWPRVTLMSIYHSLAAMSARYPGRIYVDRVSSFYALTIGKNANFIISSCVSIMGMVFAAVHCAAWNFEFPTHQELIFWRVCSVIIFAVPCLNLLSNFFIFFAEDIKPKEAGRVHYVQLAFFTVPAMISTVLLMLSLPVYIIARLGLLVEACVSLRQLAPGTLDVVDWINFIPHV